MRLRSCCNDLGVVALLTLGATATTTIPPRTVSLDLLRIPYSNNNASSSTSASSATAALNGVNRRDDAPEQRLPLFDIYNLKYAVRVKIGPTQAFLLAIDTGSSDTWVRGERCIIPTTGGAPCGSNVLVIHPEEASCYRSLNTNFTEYYGGVSWITARIYETFVGLGNLSAPMLIGVSAEEVGREDGGYTQGLLGMGMDGGSQMARLTGLFGRANFFDQFLTSAGLKTVVGVYLSDFYQPGGRIGEITLGGGNPQRYIGVPRCMPVVYPKLTWAFSSEKSKYYVGKDSTKAAPLPYNQALPDTGTSLIFLDDATAASINSKIGGKWDPNQGQYMLPSCSGAGGPTVTFVIGGHEFEITPDVYAIVTQGVACVSGFQGGGNDMIVLGDVFMRKYYTIFDKERNQVCMAPLATSVPS